MKKNLLLCGLAALALNTSAAHHPRNNPFKHKQAKEQRPNAHRSSPGTANRTNDLSFKPQKEKVSSWFNNDWSYSNDIDYTYDTKGNKTQEIRSNAGVNSSRTQYTYNPNNDVTVELYQSYANNQWENESRITYTYNSDNKETNYFAERYQGSAWASIERTTIKYDAKGNQTKNWQEKYQNSSWVTSYADSSAYTYDGQSRYTQQTNYEYDTSSKKWTPIERFTLTYSGTNAAPVTIELEEYDATWEKSEKYTDIEWYKWNGFDDDQTDVKKATYQEWNGALYTTMGRMSKTYPDTYGSNLTLSESSVDNGTTFSPADRYGATYDSHKNMTRDYEENYSGTSWEVVYESKYLNTYDSQGALTQKIDQYWINSQATNYLKHEYSSFVTLGMSSTKANTLNMTAFPNPSNGNLSLNYDLPSAETVSIAVYNTLGVRVLTIADALAQSAGSYSNNLELPSKGMYYIVVRTSSSNTTLPVVVQ